MTVWTADTSAGDAEIYLRRWDGSTWSELGGSASGKARFGQPSSSTSDASTSGVAASGGGVGDSPAAPLEFKMRLARSEVESRLYDIETPEKRTAVVEAIAAYWRRFPQDEGITALYTRLLSILRVAAPEGDD